SATTWPVRTRPRATSTPRSTSSPSSTARPRTSATWPPSCGSCAARRPDDGLAVFLAVRSSLLVGVILVVAPWTSWWEANYLLIPYPAVRALVLSAFTRGMVSGLGLVNILLAVHEAQMHFRGRSCRPAHPPGAPGHAGDRPAAGALAARSGGRGRAGRRRLRAGARE